MVDEKRTMNRNSVLGSNASHVPGNRISNSFIDSLDLELGLWETLEIKYKEKIKIYLFRGHAPQEEIDVRGRISVRMIMFADRSF